MGQSIASTVGMPAWTDRSQYARLASHDRRTWAWLWLVRTPSFQRATAAQRHTGHWQRQGGDTFVLLDENLCRLFQTGYGSTRTKLAMTIRAYGCSGIQITIRVW